MRRPDKLFVVPVFVRVMAPSAPDAKAKAIGALGSGARVPARWFTVGDPVPDPVSRS